jgi:hypothetical protein
MAEVVIGRGEPLNTSIKLFSIPVNHKIEESPGQAWQFQAYLPVQVYMWPTSVDGLVLRSLLRKKAKPEEIETFLESRIQISVPALTLQGLLDQSYDNGFEDGLRAAQLGAKCG